MRSSTSTSSTWNETRSSSASQRSRPTSSARRSVSLLKKFLSERITMFTARRLSSCSIGIPYSCSNSRKGSRAASAAASGDAAGGSVASATWTKASLSRQLDSIPECTTERMSASWSSSEGNRSFARRNASIVSCTTLPAQSGSADSFFSRRISGSLAAA